MSIANLRPVANFESMSAGTFRTDVCKFVQTQINNVIESRREKISSDNFVESEFNIQYFKTPLITIKLDVRTQKGKVQSTRILLYTYDDTHSDMYVAEAESALSVSYFVVGYALRVQEQAEA